MNREGWTINSGSTSASASVPSLTSSQQQPKVQKPTTRMEIVKPSIRLRYIFIIQLRSLRDIVRVIGSPFEPFE